MLFVSGKAEEIVASLDRRKWLRSQSVKLGSVKGALLKGNAQRDALSRAVVKQIADWMKLNSDKVLVIEYHDLWDRSREIGQHIGVDDEIFSSSFPPRRVRNSTPSLQG